MNDYPDDSYRPDDFDAARQAVRGPAIGLIVTGVISLLLAAIGPLTVGSIPAQFQQERNKINQDPNLGAAQKKDALAMFDQIEGIIVPVVIATSVLYALGAVVVIVGALKMKNLRSKGWGMTSAILAMIPFCVSYSCLLGLPFGIWALRAMGKPEVKAAFAANKRPRTEHEF